MNVRDIMKTDVTTIEDTSDVALAMQVMLWSGIRHLPVVREGRLVGILSERDVLAAGARTPPQWGLSGAGVKNVAEIMSSPARHVDPDTNIADAASLMSVTKIGCLPVVEGDRVVGLVTTTDLLAANAEYPIPEQPPLHRPIREIMTSEVATCHEDDLLLDAAARMAQRGARHLPVVDSDGRVVGILSDRDVRTAVGNPLVEAFEDRHPRAAFAELRVQHAMTKDPETLDADMPVAEAVRATVHRRFGAIPIVDSQQRLVGIVSYIDILRSVARELGAYAA